MIQKFSEYNAEINNYTLLRKQLYLQSQIKQKFLQSQIDLMENNN